MERIKLGNPFVQNKWIKVRNETSLISFGRYSYTDTQTCAHRCTHRETGYTQTHWHSVMHLTETGRHLDPTVFFRRGVGTCPLKSAQFLCVPQTGEVTGSGAHPVQLFTLTERTLSDHEGSHDHIFLPTHDRGDLQPTWVSLWTVAPHPNLSQSLPYPSRTPFWTHPNALAT